MVQIWYMDSGTEDQRKLHKQTPNKEGNLETLSSLGVYYHKLHPEKYEEGERYFEDPMLLQIKEERGYVSHDIITVLPDKLPNYDEKIKMFFREHLHTDDEVRYIIDGEGFFDIRDKEDQWIRILVEKGDLISLPSGIYHRFTVSEKNYIKAIRLYVDNTGWKPILRPDGA